MSVLRILITAPAWLSGAFVLLMAVHMTLDVVTKHFFSLPVTGTLEVVSFYYMIGIVFLPIGWLELRDRQISVDLVHDVLPSRGRRLLRLFTGLLGIGFFTVLAIRTGHDAIRSVRIAEVAMGEATLPIWPTRLFLPLGFLCGILGIAIRLLQDLGLVRQVSDD